MRVLLADDHAIVRRGLRSLPLAECDSLTSLSLSLSVFDILLGRHACDELMRLIAQSLTPQHSWVVFLTAAMAAAMAP